MQFMERMKARWGVGVWGVLAILLAFSLAGMTVVRLKGPVMGLILPSDAPAWASWPVYLLVVFPLYQVVLLFYGTVLGQFHFFWSKFKLAGRWLFGRTAPRSE